MLPSAETMKFKQCLPKLTLKKATKNIGKSDNKQIFATPVCKDNLKKQTPK